MLRSTLFQKLKGYLVLVLQVFLVLPFLLQGHGELIFNAVKGVDQYPWVSMNAYNLWYYFVDHPMETQDTIKFAGLTYKNWGLLMFCGFSALVLGPFLKDIWNHWKADKEPAYLVERICLTSGLVMIGFFYFNTQMHERYGHAAMLFFACYGYISGRYWLFFLLSIAYVLNLEDVLMWLHLKNYSILLLQPWFISTLWLVTMVLGTGMLCRHHYKALVHEPA